MKSRRVRALDGTSITILLPQDEAELREAIALGATNDRFGSD